MRLLNALFSPRRVALVGASDRAGTLGNLLARNLESFPGEVVPVRGGGSLLDVEGEIDLAVVAVPAHAVPAVAADAAAKGVGAMVVLSGGFAETGADGVALQAELVAAAGSVRIIGPNCFGIQNCDLPLNASMAAGLPRGGGGISLVSQSGAYGMAIYALAVDERARFAKILAPGNTCDVTIAELLTELADDPASETLCFLLESLVDGRAFVERARLTTPDKPVIVAKTGRSEAGARAAASHTAALAGSEAVWHGVFRQAGIVEVRSGQELLDVARALDGQPLPAGARVGIVTNSGGVGVELADLLADEGLTVPALSAPLQDKIRDMLPAFASAVNPVDVTPVWSRYAELYPGLTDLLARSGEVDVVIPVLLQRAAMDTPTAEALRDVVLALHDDAVGVPVHVCWVAPRDARPNADLLQEAGVPCFEWPARTARAVGHAHRYAMARERTAPPPPVPQRRTTPTPTDPAGAAEVLAAFGVRTATSTLCRTVDEAVDAATSYPVVVKVAAAAHRTELGGVRLGLADPDQVRAAATDLLAMGPVLVQPQLSGVEVAVGAMRDPVFGPVVMVGLGGIWVEVLADVAFALAPLGRLEARDLLAGLRGFPLLAGARGAPPVDLDALADVVVGAGNLLLAADDVAELDLNPALATQDGAIAVDWKITRDGTP
ncbi:acetate--CoA ligase family protein [Pseudonocardia sp.]|uniref:acetate--CoA ligase family protein n=1 Tax=Pseudonocardia sp. TaxID=60912 RepID=UPI00261130BB|nr:acetate--CoA ligase family protein [Pseudonocardia sp.]